MRPTRRRLVRHAGVAGPELALSRRAGGPVLGSKCGQYIFVSTISSYAGYDKPPDETAALAVYAGKDPMAETAQSLAANMPLYGPLKAVSEHEAERQFPGRVTIVRPGL